MPPLRTLAATGAALTFAACATPVMAAGQLYTHGPIELHAGPGAKFRTLANLSAGTAVTVLWCNGTADWCLLDDGIDQGWAPIDDIRGQSIAGGESLGKQGTSGGALTLPDKGVSAGSEPGGGVQSGSGGVGISITTPGVSLSVKVP